MKLELEHLSAYLPYGLKVKHECNIIMLMTCERKQGDFLSIESVIHGYGKPILRPLSDLQNKDLDLWIDFGIEIDEANTHYLIESLVKGTFYAKDIHFAFRVREALFKMHLDVFGLIDKGLAIDMNTLKS
jgi:hypothetical protein